MSRVGFISDLHLGHSNIIKFEGHNRGNVQTIEEHDQWIIDQWNSVVNKNDLIWVLGDVAFTKEGLHKLKKMKGNKHLILGNHDKFSIELYSKYFNKIHGFMSYKGFWLSHPPIRECSLRNKINIHGHIHSGKTDSDKHICVSVEKRNGKPLFLDEIKELTNE